MTRADAISVLERVVHTESKWPGTEDTLDALHMAISALRQQEPVTNRNEPLTLDELRKMDGEPVWVVCLTPEIYDEPPIRWRILEKSIIGTFGVWGNKDSCLTERDYGKTWIAYRQKPEEGTV